MNNDKLQVELEILKQQKEELEKKIKNIEEQINPTIVMDPNEKGDLKVLFQKYLTENKFVKTDTSDKYFGYLNSLKKLLKEFAGIDLSKPIYEITDIETLDEIKQQLASNQRIIDKNKKHHHVYTASFNNYYDFIKNGYDPSKKKTVDSEFVLDE